MSKNRIFLIDAYGLCYRAFYAVKGLKNSKGRPTNAVFGFCNILRKLLNDLKPTHIAVCFDTGKKTHRQSKYAEYKMQRQAMPDDLISQIKTIREIVAAYNIPVFELEGYEADDVMATLASKYAGKNTEVVIVTEDKDMGQLVGAQVKLYSARQEKILTAADVEVKFGVRPDQIIDYIALAGDASDNIPGVPGIGEAGARALLAEFGTLENIYKHLDEVKGGKLKEKLRQGEQSALLSKELATLHADVPLAITCDDLALRRPDRPRLLELYQELEFRRFAEEVSDAPPAQQAQGPIAYKDMVVLRRGNQSVSVVYDLKSLRKQGQVFEGEIFDVYLAGYLLAGGQGQYDVPSLAWRYLNKKPHEHILEELYDPMMEALARQGLAGLLEKVEMPLVEVLVQMEKDGVRLDLCVLDELSRECQAKIAEMEDGLFKSAGTKFNINSPKQLSEVLFDRLKLPVIKKTKTGFSTDEEVLTRLAEKHALPAMILEYRQIAKLKNTYIDALPQLADPQTHRIHATFNQTGAETGRLSSNNPNLQNIPARTDFGRRIRAAFVPYDQGQVLLSADYSQIELRILAHLSGDEGLKKAFGRDDDIHRHTASLMFEVSEEKVDEQMRYAAKRINFGIVYGMSAFGLAKDLNVSQRQAQEFIDTYFLRYPNVRAFLDGEIQKARDLGYATTMFNRRRYLPDINSRNMGLRQFAQRQAINAPIQGTAADLIKKAMVDIAARIQHKKLSSKMILTVHDELVFNVPDKEQEEMVRLVREGMERIMELCVPVKATVKT
ncbi:MAG: DNA polymerase I, partial [Candidatus Omnitrophica bacterium]|nr:DNA polymerase I [Candidatus Omnitrophota bacterium]